MNIDIVMPSDNEEEFLEVAEKLGYESIIFYYLNEKNIKHIKHAKIKVHIATNTKTKKNDLIIKEHDEKDRVKIERKEIDILFNLENEKRKDFLHQRASGINHIIAKLCKENKVYVAFSHHAILKAKNKAEVIGRMMQNIKLCRKYAVKMIIASFAKHPYAMRSPHDLKALGIVLGMHPSEAKAALNDIKTLIKNK